MCWLWCDSPLSLPPQEGLTITSRSIKGEEERKREIPIPFPKKEGMDLHRLCSEPKHTVVLGSTTGLL